MASNQTSDQPRVRRLASRGDRRLWVFLIVLLGAAILLASYWYLNGPGRAGGQAGAVLLDLSGDGNRTTQPFAARKNWQIAWQTEGTAFTLALRGAVDFGAIVDQQGPGSGISSPNAEGQFYLEITAQGPWTIQVTQGD